MGVFQGLCQPRNCHFRRKCDTLIEKYTQVFVKSGDKTAETLKNLPVVQYQKMA